MIDTYIFRNDNLKVMFTHLRKAYLFEVENLILGHVDLQWAGRKLLGLSLKVELLLFTYPS